MLFLFLVMFYYVCHCIIMKLIHDLQHNDRSTKFRKLTLLMGCSTGTDPLTDATTLGSVAKAMESVMKTINKRIKMLG